MKQMLCLLIVLCFLAMACQESSMKTSASKNTTQDSLRVHNAVRSVVTQDSSVAVRNRSSMLTDSAKAIASTKQKVQSNQVEKLIVDPIENGVHQEVSAVSSAQKKIVNPDTSERVKKIDEKAKPKMVDAVHSTSTPTKLPFEKVNQDIDHQRFNALLKKHVSQDGSVDYQAFLRDHDVLNTYLDELSKVEVEKLVSREAKMAYWINLYNAATINLILNNYPLARIKDLDDGKTWDVKRVQTSQGPLSLNDIENGILRPKFNDARIHFAVNCAAKSCPPLTNQAFTEQNLESLLQARTQTFINNKTYNHLAGNALSISKIFEWYESDFHPNLSNFIQKYSFSNIASDVTISFQDYDWNLNGK